MGLKRRPQAERKGGPYPPVQIVTPELHSRIGDYSYTIGAIAAHKASPALLLPHLPKRPANPQLVLGVSGALDLQQNLETLER